MLCHVIFLHDIQVRVAYNLHYLGRNMNIPRLGNIPHAVFWARHRRHKKISTSPREVVPLHICRNTYQLYAHSEIVFYLLFFVISCKQ